MAKQKPEGKNDFLSMFPAPARRALENKGIDSAEKLSVFTEKEITRLHGIGKSSIPKMQLALKQKGLSFKQ